MPVTARGPVCRTIVATMATPANPPNSEYNPTQFTMGDLLYVRNLGASGTLFQLEIDGTAALNRFWFQLGTGGPAATADAVAPLWFSGGIAGSTDTLVQGYLGRDPNAGSSATNLTMRYRKSRPVPNVYVRRFRVFVTTNTLTTSADVLLRIDGTAVPGTTLTIASGTTNTLVSSAVLPSTTIFGDGAGFQVEVNTVGGGSGNAIRLSAVAEFASA